MILVSSTGSKACRPLQSLKIRQTQITDLCKMLEFESQAALKLQLDVLAGAVSNITFPWQFKVSELFFS